MRRTRTLPVLAANGIVQRGTVIEIIPKALPDGGATQDPKVFQAKIDKPAGLRDSVLWELDGKPYSLTELTIKLWNDYGVVRLENFIFKHWRIVGHTATMWEEAEQFPR